MGRFQTKAVRFESTKEGSNGLVLAIVLNELRGINRSNDREEFAIGQA